MRASSRTAPVLIVLFVAMAAMTEVSAHRLDEFLQAARIAVERDHVRIEMTLTPGKAVADAVVNEIDTDVNGVLSRSEQEGYVARVLSAIDLRVDNSTALSLAPATSRFPDVAGMQTGDGAIRIQSVAVIPHLTAGPHQIHFRNRNDPDIAAYLANALVPETSDVAVTAQRRDGAQSELTIDLLVTDTGSSGRLWVWFGVPIGLMLAWPLTRGLPARRRCSRG